MSQDLPSLEPTRGGLRRASRCERPGRAASLCAIVDVTDLDHGDDRATRPDHPDARFRLVRRDHSPSERERTMTDDFDLPTVSAADPSLPGELELGAFSVSLTVADLEVSRAFYAKLGFVVVGGDADADYLIMKNGETTIGLFHGMFESNILTFNPGLTNRMERLEEFTDIRSVQARLDDLGVELAQRIDDDSDSGPASISLLDPDGNVILVDQFF